MFNTLITPERALCSRAHKPMPLTLACTGRPCSLFVLRGPMGLSLAPRMISTGVVKDAVQISQCATSLQCSSVRFLELRVRIKGQVGT